MDLLLVQFDSKLSGSLILVNARDNRIPVYAPDPIKSIVDIAPAVKKRLRKERVALVVLEGIDLEHF